MVWLVRSATPFCCDVSDSPLILDAILLAVILKLAVDELGSIVNS
jgi:hypothetical protein